MTGQDHISVAPRSEDHISVVLSRLSELTRQLQENPGLVRAAAAIALLGWAAWALLGPAIAGLLVLAAIVLLALRNLTDLLRARFSGV